MTQYYLSEEEEKGIRKDFLDPEKVPKLLIVTNKMLTGFDAPVLYCMYLDKPMRDHVLLQTIARVNRPYEDREGRKKPAGFILDFIGIFSNLEKALAFDSSDIEGIVNDIRKLKERFKELIELRTEEFVELREFFSGLDKLDTQDKKVEWILEHFFDEKKRQKFYQYYNELSDIYNIISPDEFLRPYLERMDALTRIYKIVREAYDPSIRIDREFSQKVERLVQEHVNQGDIKDSLDIYEINENTLKRLEEKNASDQVKVFNTAKSILKHIKTESDVSPFLISIGELVEQLMNLYRERQKSTQEVLDELKRLIEEINRAKQEQAQMHMEGDIFSIYWILKKEGIPEPERIAGEIKEILTRYPHWKISEQQERELKQKSLKILLKTNMNIKVITDLIQRILNYLKGSHHDRT
ncbi:MAG: DUF3387 domain-containing protein [Candidatus Anstonellales archaeon]